MWSQIKNRGKQLANGAGVRITALLLFVLFHWVADQRN